MTIQQTTVKAPPDLDGWVFLFALLTIVGGLVGLVTAVVLWLTGTPPNDFYGGVMLATALFLFLFAVFFVLETKSSEPFSGEKWGRGENAFLTCVAVSLVLTAGAGVSILAQGPIPFIGWVPIANIVLAFVACALYGELGSRPR